MATYKPKMKAQIALSTIEKNLSYQEAAELYNVSKSLIGTWVRKLREDAHLVFEDQRSLNKRTRVDMVMHGSRHKRRKAKL